MNSYAIVNKTTNIVVNMTVWDGISEWHPGDEYLLMQTDSAGIGDVWDGNTFITLVSPVENPV